MPATGGGRAAASPLRRARSRRRSRHRLLFPAAEHLEADLFLRDLAGVRADDLAFVDDEDAIRERDHLVELERDQQDRAALVALGDQAPMEILDCADIDAAR